MQAIIDKTWKIKACDEEPQIKLLAADLNINETLATLLIQRGIRTYDEAKAFFRPSLNDLHDPFLMTDMDKAVERLSEAIEKKQKILVYGDYDVDGTTAVSLVYSFIRKLHKEVDFYVPDRYKEGYGVSYDAIEYAALNGYNLIIALDCGIKAVDKVEFAKGRSIDFIICDHHTPGDELPNAYAVLDPKRSDCNYPYNELSGCGVGFKLLQAYCIKHNIDQKEVYEYLDLCVVSIASDIVPITGENRVLAHFGLKKLNENPTTGIESIIRIAGVENKELVIEDIVFRIGPRINAAGRIESGSQAVELLTETDIQKASSICSLINEHNQIRKNIDKSITDEALQILRKDVDLENKYSIVLYNHQWHKGVIGIVASRLIEHYYRPTIILTESNGLATGSARSVEGFDLYEAICECSDLLESYGGHMYAAGLSMKIENVEKFRKRFEAIVKRTITPEQRIPQVDIDAELEFSDITPKFFRILKQFEPFGPENMKPVFFTENVSDNGQGRPVGADNEHLKLSLVHENEPFTVYPAIGFGLGSIFNKVKNGVGFDIAYSLNENTYMGKTTLQLNIKDIKL
jgi:single-stranded-DNA-specific exonuclease